MKKLLLAIVLALFFTTTASAALTAFRLDWQYTGSTANPVAFEVSWSDVANTFTTTNTVTTTYKTMTIPASSLTKGKKNYFQIKAKDLATDEVSDPCTATDAGVPLMLDWTIPGKPTSATGTVIKN